MVTTTTTTTTTMDPTTVDRVLLQVGRVGLFQVLNHLAINLPIFFTAFYTLTYVFTAQDLTYRCLVPECEVAGAAGAPFSPPWLPWAVPYNDGNPAPCSRFGRNASATDATCSADLFDKARPEQCDQWVFKPDQRTSVVSEWNLTCDDNKWKLSFVGTLGYVGSFFGMPVAGFISDRFGRKTLLVWAGVLCSLAGLLQSFATNFTMFLCLQFLEYFFEAGVYGAGFLLALEFVGPEKRVLATTVLSLFYSFGNAVLGALAWGLQDWRWLLRAVFGGGLACMLTLIYTPESVRWLAAQGRLEEGDAIVARVAAINGVTVTETLVDVAERQRPEKSDGHDVESSRASDRGTLHDLRGILTSRTLLLRSLNCAYCWMANTFVYYGMSLNAVSLSGNEYLNFILSGLVELPANFLHVWLQGWCGRRGTLAGTLVLAGVCCIAFLAVPEELQWLQVALYMLGKFAVSISFTAVYVITAEMFPTNARNSMVSCGSCFGRIGSMLAPQTPLLATLSASLPLTLFGLVSISSGLLVLCFPETRGRPLPETLKEAEEMPVGCCLLPQCRKGV